jgi:hypothetical protein
MTIKELVNESICAKQPHMFPQYFSWGWIDPAGEIICPTESDKTHTSILRRLADQYNLPEDASEHHATKHGWIRWLVEYDSKTKNFVLFFNTVKFKKTPKIYNSILRIINDNADAKFYNFLYVGGSNWIQALTKQKFIDELSNFFGINHNQEITEDKPTGGLTKWFKEKWVNIAKKKGGKHPPCGTSGETRGYAKCVPAKKAASMSKKEKQSAVNRKRSAQRAADRPGRASGGTGKKPIRVKTDKE